MLISITEKLDSTVRLFWCQFMSAPIELHKQNECVYPSHHYYTAELKIAKDFSHSSVGLLGLLQLHLMLATPCGYPAQQL